MQKLIVPWGERGKELSEILIRELGIPDKTKWFEVRFALGEPVSVKCEFLPVEDVACAPER